MPDPVISEIKYLGGGSGDYVEVRVPDDYPDPANLRLVVYDRNHNGSTTQSPAASDIHNVTADGLLYTEDVDMDTFDDDGILHYTFGTPENGTNIRLHAQDAVGLYNAVTGETYGLYNWSGSPYTVSTASGDPFAGQTATLLDNTGQISGVTSLIREPGGNYVLNSTPDPGSSYVCFTKGTQILTTAGERAIEDLAIGDWVITMDHGTQRIRWIGKAEFSGHDPALHAEQPITINANAFGPGVPARTTRLSPNHAILNKHWKAPIYFGEDEVLTEAKALPELGFGFHSALTSFTYYHILLDQHGLVLANGMWSETLFLGSQCMAMLCDRSRSEVLDVFPDLRSDLRGYGPKARPVVKPKDAAVLLM